MIQQPQPLLQPQLLLQPLSQQQLLPPLKKPLPLPQQPNRTIRMMMSQRQLLFPHIVFDPFPAP